MREQQIVLEDDPDGPLLRRGVLEPGAVEPQMPAAERDQPGEGTQRGGLPGAVRPEQRDDLAGRGGQRDVQPEAAALHDEPGVESFVRGGHEAVIQRSRRAARTATDTASRTRLSATAASGSFWRARYTASGMVWVRPGKLPAKVMVAPNSPRARAQARTAPAATPGAISGRVTRRNAANREAPSVCAASS
ncbi:hypothetical protein GCM10020256_31870 [Streptomyces thermocoprophilus]